MLILYNFIYGMSTMLESYCETSELFQKYSGLAVDIKNSYKDALWNGMRFVWQKHALKNVYGKCWGNADVNEVEGKIIG